MAYEVLETRVEELKAGRLRVVTLLGPLVGERPAGRQEEAPLSDEEVGEGPSRETVPDRIVLALIAGGGKSQAGFELKPRVGGNESTFYRQVRTLATNAPDTPKRLRGWVTYVEHGRYALSGVARRRLEDPATLEHWMERARRILR